MKYYMVVELNVTDDSWVPSYLENVTRLTEAAGGRYLARTPQVEKMEGEREAPQFCVIIEFPSKEAATTLMNSPEYQPYLEQRQAGSDTELMLVAGEDIAKS